MTTTISLEDAFAHAHPFFRSIDLRISLLELFLLPPYLRGEHHIGVNRRCLVACMCVCRAWFEIGRSLLWRNIKNPETALRAALDQANAAHPDVVQYTLSYKSLFMRLSVEALERYRQYTECIRSMDNYRIDKHYEDAFSSLLFLLPSHGEIFPNLRHVVLQLGPDFDEPIPPPFRTNKLTSVTIRAAAILFIPGEPILKEVVKYCPLLEEWKMNLLIDVPTLAGLLGGMQHLHSLSVQIDVSQFNQLMKFLLERADKMILIDINMARWGPNGKSTQFFTAQDNRHLQFPRLRNLSISAAQPPECIIGLTKGFPSAAMLEAFTFSVLVNDFEDYGRMMTSLCSAVEELWHRSPFSHLRLSFDYGYPIVANMDLSPLSNIRSLKSFSIHIGGVRTIPSDALIAVAGSWQGLQELSFTFSSSLFDDPYWSLEDVLRLASRLPKLSDVTVSVSIRASDNAKLQHIASGDRLKEDISNEQSLTSFGLQYLELHLMDREIDSNLPSVVLQKLTPNIEIIVLKSSEWRRPLSVRPKMKDIGFFSNDGETYRRARKGI